MLTEPEFEPSGSSPDAPTARKSPETDTAEPKLSFGAPVLEEIF